MISIKELRKLEFNSMDEFYNYIIESEKNGQFKQVKELIKKLSGKQYNGFLMYLKDNDIKLNDHFLKP